MSIDVYIQVIVLIVSIAVVVILAFWSAEKKMKEESK